MIRVVHVVDSLAETGGAERRLVEEVVAMSHRFADQRVVRLFERDELQDRLERAGIPVTALGLSGRRAGRTWPWAAARLHATLRRWRPDVVHTTLFTANLVGQLAARPLRIPVVSSFNRTGEIGLQRALQPGMAGWRGRTMHAIARRAARSDGVRFRAVSAYARDSNCELFRVPPSRVTVVPRGIDVEPPSPAVDRSAFGLRAGRAALRQRRPDGAGEGAASARRIVRRRAGRPARRRAGRRRRGRLRRTAQCGRPSPVTVSTAPCTSSAGARTRSALIAAADVFVFSSLSEGSPSAVLEAMALGTPVVAFDIAPVVELTGGYARLVPAGSTSELGKAMVAAYTAADREATARSATSLGGAVHPRRRRRPARRSARAAGRSAVRNGERPVSSGASLGRGVAVVSIDTELAWGEAHRRDGGARRATTAPNGR